MYGDKRPRPLGVPSTEPFWNAASQGRLSLPKYDGVWEPYPRPGAKDPVEWATASSTGEVYTFSVVHHSPYADLPAPFVIAVVQLDDGPRIVTNIVEADPASIKIGMPVELTFTEMDDLRLPVFRPAS